MAFIEFKRRLPPDRSRDSGLPSTTLFRFGESAGPKNSAATISSLANLFMALLALLKSSPCTTPSQTADGRRNCLLEGLNCLDCHDAAPARMRMLVFAIGSADSDSSSPSGLFLRILVGQTFVLEDSDSLPVTDHHTLPSSWRSNSLRRRFSKTANGLFKLFTLDGFMEGVWCLDLVRVVVFLCSWLASSSSRFVVWYVACIGWLAVCCSLVDRLFCLAAGSSSRTSSSLLCADYLTSRRCRALSVPQRFAVEALGLVSVRQVLSISAC